LYIIHKSNYQLRALNSATITKHPLLFCFEPNFGSDIPLSLSLFPDNNLIPVRLACRINAPQQRSDIFTQVSGGLIYIAITASQLININ
jgi:hypothetical protein